MCGIPLVLSDRSSESEYFGDLADYVNPLDIDGMVNAISRRGSMCENKAYKASLQELIQNKFTWDRHVQETHEFYKQISSCSPSFSAFSSRNGVNQNKKKSSFDCIIVDITDYVYSPNPTGIPRVVEKISQEANNNQKLKTCFVCWKKNSRMMIPIPSKLVNKSIKDMQEKIREYVEKTEVNKNVCFEFDDLKLVKSPILLFIGGVWTNPDFGLLFIEAFTRLKNKYELPVALLIHDLIRWEFSYLYSEKDSAAFQTNLRSLLHTADLILYYSEATKQQLLEFNRTHKINASLKYSKVILGSELSNDFNHENESSIIFKNRNIIKGKFILYVATLDPRKNHDFLLDVWKNALKMNPANQDFKLIIVGRSLKNSSLERKINKYIQDQLGVIHLQSINDSDLAWLYKNCIFTVFPSLAEGWGLPVAESLSYGKFCIASDSTSIKEIAPDLIDLIDPKDHKNWVESISFYMQNSEAVTGRNELIKKHYSAPSWKDSADSIVDSIASTSDLYYKPNLMVIDRLYTASNKLISNNNLSLFLNHGWFLQADSVGHWMVNNISSATFSIAQINHKFSFFRIYLYSIKPCCTVITLNQLKINCTVRGNCYLDIPLDKIISETNQGVFKFRLAFMTDKNSYFVAGGRDTRHLYLKLNGAGVFSSEINAISFLDDEDEFHKLHSRLQPSASIFEGKVTPFETYATTINTNSSLKSSNKASAMPISFYKKEIQKLGRTRFTQKYSHILFTDPLTYEEILFKGKIKAILKFTEADDRT
jgi:glycosyltransferase involved in cell wall biosynthesis